jgi:hypothetical protein
MADAAGVLALIYNEAIRRYDKEIQRVGRDPMRRGNFTPYGFDPETGLCCHDNPDEVAVRIAQECVPSFDVLEMLGENNRSLSDRTTNAVITNIDDPEREIIERIVSENLQDKIRKLLFAHWDEALTGRKMVLFTLEGEKFEILRPISPMAFPLDDTRSEHTHDFRRH